MTGKILVTGGTGFIGRFLVEKLNQQHQSLRILSRHIPQVNRIPRVEYVSGSFTSDKIVQQVLQGVDIVYHLATTTYPAKSNGQIIYDAETNLIGTLKLIEAAALMGVKRFIFASSGGTIYGPTSQKGPISETQPTNPITAHTISKLAIEKYLPIFYRRYGMTYRIARGANPYGIGQQPNKGQGFIGSTLHKLAFNEEVVVWGDGRVVRDFFYVGDFADALVAMLDDEAPHNIYNVGSGLGRSLCEIIRTIEEVTGRQLRVRYEPSRSVDLPFNCLDITRIRRHLGWSPQISLHEGLHKTWTWQCTKLPNTPQTYITS